MLGQTRSRFVRDSALLAAAGVLADRTHFVLRGEALIAWDAINAAPARDLPGLRAFMKQESLFSD